MKKWQCVVCGLIYDESQGWPDEGIAAGTLLVFVPAIGMFAITDLMGGAKVPMIGNVNQNQFMQARDWPFGAAISLALMALVMILLITLLRQDGEAAL